MTPCWLVNSYRPSRGYFYFQIYDICTVVKLPTNSDLKTEAVRFSETSAITSQSAWIAIS